MHLAVVVAAAVVAVLIVGILALMIERFRRNRRFSRKIRRYERRRLPGQGQIIDPEDLPRR